MTKKENMRLDDLKFLKVDIKKHPTKDFDLEYLIKQDAIASLVVNNAGDKVLLVKQYRPGVDDYIYEVPAGLIDPGENPISTLYREIKEETGYTSSDYDVLYTPKSPLTVSPGYTQEKLYIYVIRLKSDDITPIELDLDEGEDLEVAWVDIDKVLEISQDMKTHLALFIYKQLNI